MMTDPDPYDDNQADFAEALERRYEQLIGRRDDSLDDSISDERLSSAVRVLELLEGFSGAIDAEAGSETHAFQSTVGSPHQPGTADATADDSPASPDLRRLGRFEIIQQIGRGGYGIVLRARAPELDRDVAINIPKLDTALSPEARSRFSNESRAAASLSHPNIVPVFESGEIGGVALLSPNISKGRLWTSGLPPNPTRSTVVRPPAFA